MKVLGNIGVTDACLMGFALVTLALTMVLAAYVGSLVGGILTGIMKVGFLAGYHLFTN